jgi:hypothetical protein
MINLTQYYDSLGFVLWMSLLFFMKTTDILFKLHLFKKIDNNEDLNNILPIDIEIGSTLRYFNVVLYPFIFFVAIN